MGEDFKGKDSNVSSGEVLGKVYSILKEKHKPKEIVFDEPIRSIWEDYGNVGHFSMTHMKYSSAGIFNFGEMKWVISEGRNSHNNERVYGDLIAFELYPSFEKSSKKDFGEEQIIKRVSHFVKNSNNLDSLLVAYSDGPLSLIIEGRFFGLMRDNIDKVYHNFRVDKSKFKPETSNFLADSVERVLSESKMPEGIIGLLLASKY